MHHSINKKKLKGYTLIEFVIVIVISGILIIGASNLLGQGANSFISAENTIKSNWQNSITLETMIRDLRIIRSPLDITTANSTSIVYNDINVNAMQYSINGASQLVRTKNGIAQTLANGMQNLSFSYYNSVGGAPSSNADIRYIVVNLGAQQPIATIYLWDLQ